MICNQWTQLISKNLAIKDPLFLKFILESGSRFFWWYNNYNQVTIRRLNALSASVRSNRYKFWAGFQSHHGARELSLERREGRREILETSLWLTRSLYVSGTKVAMPSGFMFLELSSHSHIARTHVWSSAFHAIRIDCKLSPVFCQVSLTKC